MNRTFVLIPITLEWSPTPCVLYHDLSALLPTLKEQCPWLSDVSSVPLQQGLRHLETAFQHFFAGQAKYPTFKKRQHAQSVTYASNAFKWGGATLTLAKMEMPLDIHWHRPLPKNVKPSSVTMSKDCANRYFVSILMEEEIAPLPVVPKYVGLDLGLTSMVILSTGEAVGNPRFFRKEEKRLAKAQRRHAKIAIPMPRETFWPRGSRLRPVEGVEDLFGRKLVGQLPTKQEPLTREDEKPLPFQAWGDVTKRRYRKCNRTISS